MSVTAARRAVPVIVTRLAFEFVFVDKENKLKICRDH